MEKIQEKAKEIIEKHGKTIALGTGIAATALASYYLFKRITKSTSMYQDSEYKKENLPLYH